MKIVVERNPVPRGSWGREALDYIGEGLPFCRAYKAVLGLCSGDLKRGEIGEATSDIIGSQKE